MGTIIRLIFLEKQPNTATYIGIRLNHSGNYLTFLRKNMQSFNISFNFYH